MPTWIALLRGINVGGKNLLPMADLRDDLALLGYCDVRTYIQSGNIVFRSSRRSARTLSKEIASLIEKRHNFTPAVLVLSPAQLDAALANNPFPSAAAEPKTLHFFFLSTPPTHTDWEKIAALKRPGESFHLTPEVFYLHTPRMGWSKLGVGIEKLLCVAATARNFRTVQKLQAMVGR